MTEHPHRRALHAAFATEQAVYGVLLVAGLIVVSGLHASSSLEVLITVVFTVLVFWLAHVYAGALARHGVRDGQQVGVRESVRASLRASAGLLVSALVPCAVLLLGTLRVVPDRLAEWAALWVCVAILGVLGFVGFRRRGASPLMCVVGALSTAAFGALMALLKAFVH